MQEYRNVQWALHLCGRMDGPIEAFAPDNVSDMRPSDRGVSSQIYPCHQTSRTEGAEPKHIFTICHWTGRDFWELPICGLLLSVWTSGLELVEIQCKLGLAAKARPDD
jgi:hypothetical protein